MAMVSYKTGPSEISEVNLVTQKSVIYPNLAVKVLPYPEWVGKVLLYPIVIYISFSMINFVTFILSVYSGRGQRVLA